MVKKKREFQFSSATFLFAAAALAFSGVYAIQLGNRTQAAGSANISATLLSKSSSSVQTIPLDKLSEFVTIDRSDSRWAGRAIKGVYADVLDYWVVFGPSSTDTNSLIVRFSTVNGSAQATKSVDLGQGGKATIFNEALYVLKDKNGLKSIEVFNYRTLEHWEEDSIPLGSNRSSDFDLFLPTTWEDGPAVLAYSKTTKKAVWFNDMYEKIDESVIDMDAITDPKSIAVRGNRIFKADSAFWGDMVQRGEITVAQQTDYQVRFADKSTVIYSYLNDGTYHRAYYIPPVSLSKSFEGMSFIGYVPYLTYADDSEIKVYSIDTATALSDIGQTRRFDFDLNGGTGDVPALVNGVSEQCFTPGDLLVPSRTGYNFLGWSLDKDAKQATTTPICEFGSPKKTIVVYALWQEDGNTPAANDEPTPASPSSPKVVDDKPKNPNTADEIAPFNLVGAITCAGLATLFAILKRRR